MAAFSKILVGIDFTQCAQIHIDTLPPTVHNVFEHAVWLARKTGGRLTLMSALDFTAILLDDLSENHRLALTRTIDADANRVLSELAERARQAGVEAEIHFEHGKGWLELIHQAIRGRHDLLLVAARRIEGTDVRRMLLGSTALKLFRRCPCPVWVVKPGRSLDQRLNVLLAHDLKPASEVALQLIVALGQVIDLNLQVFHVVEYPLFPLSLTSLPNEIGPDFERREYLRAEQKLHDQLTETLLDRLPIHVTVHLSNEFQTPDEAIIQFIRGHHIDLLVMGSIGRAGIAGIMIGNTAERLLPEVPCSVLAVKPPDFVSPIRD